MDPSCDKGTIGPAGVAIRASPIASGSVRIGIANKEIERSLPFPHDGDGFALNGDVDGFREMSGSDAVAGHGPAVGPHLQLWHLRLLLRRDVHQSLNLVGDGFDLAGGLAQLPQVGSEDADRDRRARSGEHVIDAVADGLSHRDAGSRYAREMLTDLGQDFGEFSIGEIQLGLDMGDVRALSFFVQFGPAGASRGRDHSRHLQQPLLHPRAGRVRFLE